MNDNGNEQLKRDIEVCDMCGHEHKQRHIRDRILQIRTGMERMKLDHMELMDRYDGCLELVCFMLKAVGGEIRISRSLMQELVSAAAEKRFDWGFLTYDSTTTNSIGTKDLMVMLNPIKRT